MTKKRTTTRRSEKRLVIVVTGHVALTLVMKGRTFHIITNAPDIAPLTTVITQAERLGYEVLEARLVDASPPGYFYVYDLEDWSY